MINTTQEYITSNHIRETHEMVCNKCYCNFTDKFPVQRAKTNLKKLARRNGWVILSDYNTICPNCKADVYHKPRKKRAEVIRYNIYNV